MLAMPPRAGVLTPYPIGPFGIGVPVHPISRLFCTSFSESCSVALGGHLVDSGPQAAVFTTTVSGDKVGGHHDQPINGIFPWQDYFRYR